ncbi:uncharacterized protein [Rutidosis leptorrhynchoides]|uniref:uncharacterized protein n=1 Tax=Rutidosis leptorrhynchoides TaxID=125765 RepID=UPI003A9924F9
MKPRKDKIQTDNDEIVQVKSGGTIEISPTVKLPNCLYIPALSHKLLSGGLYYVDEVSQQGTVSLAHGTPTREAWLWHRRLGHPSAGYLHALIPSLFLSNVVLNCETCILAKSHRRTFKPSDTRKDEPFALIHSDVWGPASVIGGKNLRYFVLFIDDHMRMTWIYFLTHKLEVFEKFSHFYKMRVNRGVPPKRYSPEKEAQRSRYPIANIARGNLSNEAQKFNSALYSEKITSTVDQSMKSDKWRKAMEEEIEALKKSDTWEKCTIPQGKKPVGCRWVFTIKRKPDGTIERYKARLVSKGYTQTYGIDYSETFSPVAKIDTIRVLFSIAANENWTLHQFDIKNVFLHGELKEEVYMEAPPRFVGNFNDREVCRLKKSLYGLKQSPRAWFGKFTLFMKKI